MDRTELRPALRQRFTRERTNLLPALHYLQNEFGHLPEWALEIVGWHLRIPASQVYGAATSYSELRITAPGRHLVRVCSGLACWYSGGRELLNRLSSQWNLQPGQQAPDGAITLEETACGFLCPMAPAVEVDRRWYGRVTMEHFDRLVKELD